MTIERLAIDTDDLIRRYVAGESLRQIGISCGVSHGAIGDRLRHAGIPIRQSDIPARHLLDDGTICSRYTAGESEQAIAADLHTSRAVIRKRLLAAGIAIRGRSAANAITLGKRTEEEKRSFVQAAHTARRGQRDTWEVLCARAQAREATCSHATPTELLLQRWLLDRGIASTAQKAIGPYNADIAIGAVAVEIYGGGWHHTGRALARAPQRFRYLFDQGWSLIVIWTDARARKALQPGAADYIVTFLQHAQSNPPARGEYRVIWGTGEPVAASSEQMHTIASIVASCTA